MDVNISQLRQQLPEYLALVRQGERIRVTSRGRVVAELMPPLATPDEAASARERLKGSVLRYIDPIEPVFAYNEWRMHR